MSQRTVQNRSDLHRCSPNRLPTFFGTLDSRMALRWSVVTRSSRGFTLIELIAALLIVALLLATFVPYAMSLRETSARVRCTGNLKNIWQALDNYGDVNGYFYPRTRFDEKVGNAWTAFTGPDDRNPFLPDSAVKPNDVSASLWLLVREGLAQPGWFICPSSWGHADRMLDAEGNQTVAKNRGNFRGPDNLTYSYATPFSSIVEYRLSDTLPARFVLLADQGPAFDQLSERTPPFNARPSELSVANSVNHRLAGQNVLYADGSISFITSPYCGVRKQGPDRRTSDVNDGDNIYTALAAEVLIDREPAANEPGVAGTKIGPAYRYDTYLVPPAAFKPE